MVDNGGLHPERCILVTGGAGYTGSHASLQLLVYGYKVVVMDNVVNSCEEGIRRVVALAGKQGKNLSFHKVCDYTHVQDLATGHSAALQKLFTTPEIGSTAYNLGTGKKTSVLEIVSAFEKAAGMKIPLRLADRRPGDSSVLFTSTDKAERELGWKAQNGIDEMCRDQWKWASNNPNGYRTV